MAILCQLSYLQFRDEDWVALAGELAQATGTDPKSGQVDRLRALLSDKAAAEREVLPAVLSVGGFRRIDPFPEIAPFTESNLAAQGVTKTPGITQGFVAVRDSGDQAAGDQADSMAVLCFRGTTKVADLLTNFKFKKVPACSGEPDDLPLGNVHEGFDCAYKKVRIWVVKNLEGLDALPLYVTGHSRGGALATLAALYRVKENLTACYTFGTPGLETVSSLTPPGPVCIVW